MRFGQNGYDVEEIYKAQGSRSRDLIGGKLNKQKRETYKLETQGITDYVGVKANRTFGLLELDFRRSEGGPYLA